MVWAVPLSSVILNSTQKKRSDQAGYAKLSILLAPHDCGSAGHIRDASSAIRRDQDEFHGDEVEEQAAQDQLAEGRLAVCGRR